MPRWYALMFQVPTSSAMMTTMLGFFPEALGSPWAADFFASAWTTNELLAGPSGEQERRLTSGSDTLVSAVTSGTGRRTPSACEAGTRSLVAMRKPRNPPSPMHATD
jgi:hypothetical protein